MADRFRAGLRDLADIFGKPLAEAAPEPELPVEAPVELPVAGSPPPIPAEPDARAEEPRTSEQPYLKSSSLALSVLKGREFQAAPGATLTIDKVKHPQFHRPKKHVDVLVPLVVTYAGKAAPEEWAKAETAVEKEVLAALKANVGQAGDLAGRLSSMRVLRRR